MSKWYTELPKCEEKKFSKEILALVKIYHHDVYELRIVKAVYVPSKHCTIDDVGWHM